MRASFFHCFTVQTVGGRRALTLGGAMLAAGCVVYTPDLLNDDAVSLGGKPTPPASAPAPNRTQSAASATPIAAPAPVALEPQRLSATPRVPLATTMDAGYASESAAWDAGPDADVE